MSGRLGNILKEYRTGLLKELGKYILESVEAGRVTTCVHQPIKLTRCKRLASANIFKEEANPNGEFVYTPTKLGTEIGVALMAEYGSGIGFSQGKAPDDIEILDERPPTRDEVVDNTKD